MIHGISFATNDMSISAQKCRTSFARAGAIFFKQYDDSSEPVLNLMKEYPRIMFQPRGCGYWLWKPAIILDRLKSVSDNDIVIYADAGVECIGNLNQIVANMDQDVFLFGNRWEHAEWCKADVMQHVNGISYIAGKQAQASVIAIRKTDTAIKFIQEWLNICTIPGLIDDSPSKIDNIPTFQEHRHDQAILTSLAIRDGIRLHWWPASYNNGAFVYDKTGYESDRYSVLFNHHRKRNNEY